MILATHSDRLLDALLNPQQSAVLCRLNEKRETELLKPDKDALEDWMKNYRGLGELRAKGYENFVMNKPA